MQSRLYGLTPTEVRSLAYGLAEKNGIEHRFSNKKAGRDWLNDFIKRCRVLSFRRPEPTSAARAHRFTKENVTEFFDFWQEVLDEYHFTADRI